MQVMNKKQNKETEIIQRLILINTDKFIALFNDEMQRDPWWSNHQSYLAQARLLTWEW